MNVAPSQLFAYGTLMCADIMCEVAAQRVVGQPARLRGYMRRAVLGEVFPGIVPADDGLVEGMLWQGLTAAAWTRLDAFEGAMYVRQSVHVVARSDQVETAAHTYLVRPQFAHRLADRDWDVAAFVDGAKEQFQQCYDGYKMLATEQEHGVTPITESLDCTASPRRGLN
jgi:gamma-glutamylcyclotransferase (GGCT)/AIG2-like uncharacterized protein YtfP